MSIPRVLIKSFAQAILQPVATCLVCMGIIAAALWPVLLGLIIDSHLGTMGVIAIVTTQILWWIVVAVIAFMVALENSKQP